jgi:GTP cyclohydrolase I
MSKYNLKLGKKIQKILIKKGIETPMANNEWPKNFVSVPLIQQNVKQIMQQVNLNLKDDSLKKTPQRVALMYVNEIWHGLNYINFPNATTFKNKYKYDEMVTQDKIQVMSMCEHHLMPIDGFAKIAYIPNGNVIGLSKLNRVVDFFSRRPQVQERLTEQIYCALQYILKTDNIAIKIVATHYCIKARGIKDQQSEMTTTKLGGKFKKLAIRSEFLTI